MSNILPALTLGRLGGQYGEFSDVQPFTIRSGYSYEGILSDIRTWIRDELIPYLTVNNAQQTWDANAAALTAEVTEYLNDAIQQVLNGSVPVNDALLLAVLTAPNTNTTKFFADRYGDSAFHTAAYGAKPSASPATNRVAIQAAVDAAAAAYIATLTPQTVWLSGGVHLVDQADYYGPDGSVIGAVSIMLKDGVTIDGPGTLKVAPGSYGPGANYGVIRSKASGVFHAGVRNITIDGNKTAFVANTQASNIELVGLGDLYIEKVKSLHANGQGIRVKSPNASVVMTNVHVKNCFVQDVSGIGIQCSSVKGCQIQGNIVNGCNDNGIDVYNENGTGTPSGGNIDVSGNTVDSAAVAIFIETCRYVTVTNNNISSCAISGVRVSRINGAPQGVVVSSNQIDGTPTGVEVLGVTLGTIISLNVINGVSVAGVRLGYDGDCANVTVKDNWIDAADGGTHPLVWLQGGTISHVRVSGTRTTSTHPEFWCYTNATATSDVSVQSPAANA